MAPAACNWCPAEERPGWGTGIDPLVVEEDFRTVPGHNGGDAVTLAFRIWCHVDSRGSDQRHPPRRALAWRPSGRSSAPEHPWWCQLGTFC
jgi:hypothetical protein